MIASAAKRMPSGLLLRKRKALTQFSSLLNVHLATYQILLWKSQKPCGCACYRILVFVTFEVISVIPNQMRNFVLVLWTSLSIYATLFQIRKAFTIANQGKLLKLGQGITNCGNKYKSVHITKPSNAWHNKATGKKNVTVFSQNIFQRLFNNYLLGINLNLRYEGLYIHTLYYF